MPTVDSGRDATRRCVFFLLNGPIGDGSECSVLLVQLHQRKRLGASDHGAEFGAKIYDVELPVKSPSRQCRAQELGVSNDDAETCKIGASNDNAELRVQILKSFL